MLNEVRSFLTTSTSLGASTVLAIAVLLLVVLFAPSLGGEGAIGGPVAEASVGGVVAVNSTLDTNDRDNVITLREAVLLVTGDLAVGDLSKFECPQVFGGVFNAFGCLAANPPSAVNPDKIVFSGVTFPHENPGVITVTSNMPPLSTGSDLIEASFTGVIVDGGGTQFNRDCIVITSDDNVVRGLQVTNCGNGILIDGGSSNTIGGTTNESLPSAANVQRNEIFDNKRGIQIAGGADNAIIANLIGTDGLSSPSGAVPSGLANEIGIHITQGSTGNTIGGATEAERNIISGNTTGVLIQDAQTADNRVIGNYIGSDITGTQAVPNGTAVSMLAGAHNNTLGGAAEGERNLISGNSVGIQLGLGEANAIIGNFVGADVSGNSPLPNGLGVSLTSGATASQIGGAGEGEGNLLSGNGGQGLSIGGGATATLVYGNHIGVGADDETQMGNGTWGVRVTANAFDNFIGGVDPGQGNIIAHNVEEGVRVDGEGSTGNTIRGNSIFSNGLQGIGNQEGGNTELPPPVITGFGSVTGTACAGCTIDIYSDGEDEGRTYEGSTTADPSGDWTFDGAPQGPFVTATATDADGNTSEFSEPRNPPGVPTPTATPPAPTPTPQPLTLFWGDDDCNGSVAAVDALKNLQHVAAINFTQSDPCFPLGETVGVTPVGAANYPWGDVDCDQDVDAVDALSILRRIAALPVTQQPGCPEIGDEVLVT